MPARLSKKKKVVAIKTPRAVAVLLLLVILIAVSVEVFMLRRSFTSFKTTDNGSISMENLSIDDLKQPLSFGAVLAAGNKLKFYWTANNDNTLFYRLYHGVKLNGSTNITYGESYDSQDYATALDFDYSGLSTTTPHYFALSAVGKNKKESQKSTPIEIDFGNLNKCGNGILEAGNDEICDNSTKACTAAGAYRGVLNCAADCQGWETNCQAIEGCGDAIKNGNEQCDKAAPITTLPCTQGLYTGLANCTDQCTLGTCNIGSQACGNGQLEGGETCRDNGSNSMACTWNGFSGTKNCNAATCVWQECIVDGQCGLNGGNWMTGGPFPNLTELEVTSPGNCASGLVQNFNSQNPGFWQWWCIGNPNNRTMVCRANKKTNGACGTSANATFVAAPSTGLCAKGTSSTPVISNGFYTWSCAGVNGGTNANCQASVCGNGIVQMGEQCDFGANGANSGCTTFCQWQSYLYSCAAYSSPKPAPHASWNGASVGFNGSYQIACLAVNNSGNACGLWSPAQSVTQINTTPSNTACNAVCDAGWFDCDAAINNGCEANLSSNNNCGVCGRQCDAHADCVNQGGAYNCVCKTGWSGNGTTCSATPICGDGVVSSSEQCDFGSNNGSTVHPGCTSDCKWSDVSKQCDDQGDAANVLWCPPYLPYAPWYTTKCKAQGVHSTYGIICDTLSTPVAYYPKYSPLTCYGQQLTAKPCAFICTDGFGNCNGDDNDGCESALDNNYNCGQCGFKCDPDAGASCVLDTLVEKQHYYVCTCEDGSKDCNGKPNDGCECGSNTTCVDGECKVISL